MYLNCCTMPSIVVPHAWQSNDASISSGRTSDVRVTVAEMVSNLPTTAVFSSRSLVRTHRQRVSEPRRIRAGAQYAEGAPHFSTCGRS
eukprot:COSAG02_NODE_353_length_24023_cov_77.872304_15_plen_88_part_00